MCELCITHIGTFGVVNADDICSFIYTKVDLETILCRIVKEASQVGPKMSATI